MAKHRRQRTDNIGQNVIASPAPFPVAERETCGNCRFVQSGVVCRRYPPTIGQTSLGEPMRIWPTIRSDDWCGEWKAKNG